MVEQVDSVARKRHHLPIADDAHKMPGLAMPSAIAIPMADDTAIAARTCTAAIFTGARTGEGL
ncbi:MAG: hypothetical protein GEV03_25525 [Streptosporangiales bacterium]|nr:hypothetical protein [Streptosporangiales bacterium]